LSLQEREREKGVEMEYNTHLAIIKPALAINHTVFLFLWVKAGLIIEEGIAKRKEKKKKG